MAVDPNQLKVILVTDCGSTTTKAILIEYKNGEYRQTTRGEAPTTVEKPFEDVTKGVLNAVREVEELCGRRILKGEDIITPVQGNEGVDIYMSTSSAGGGLQMMVAGVVKTMTGESAARAALGAGAIVMDVLASNDGRLPHQRIERIRHLRPDMILLSGGIDGGTVTHVAEMAELIGAADPKPRFGTSYMLPVIYAGNKDAREIVTKTLGEKTALLVKENLRPVLERENLKPARDAIHDVFMEHVMAHAPGYKKLMAMAHEVPIMPTPGAVGLMIQSLAKADDIAAVGVDIGGATTDVFSVFYGLNEKKERAATFNRTVSANLGMSYSISNVLAEAGLENIMRWVPFEMDEADLRNRIRNKMIRPTTIPQSLEELQIEQAISREALRLAFKQHKEMAVGLKGVQQERTISDAFDQSGSGDTLINMMDLNIMIGSGGVLSHAPRRAQSALMMIDAFEPSGITTMAVDSIFMAPHLGVLSTVHAPAANEVFVKDCLVRLGSAICPAGQGKEGQPCVTVRFTRADGSKVEESVKVGEMKLIPLGAEKIKAQIILAKHFDLGAGKGKELEATLEGGTVGVIIDGRGRILVLPADKKERIRKLNEWNQALNIYPTK
ncbi:glutamate mutase L [candidate division TA06 bacterium]|uniref:Glutamate mutase L n=1 Tax=candidate division TA06 bacterium TaxID=2250710 RepID=A0A933I9C2_UNCT6|nr:glutamate mutase L [candidate division TA06 bacterium]